MPTSSVGTTNRRSNQAGVTLVEMLIVVALVGLLASVTYPSAAAGIDSMRLRGASNEVVSFLNVALERAARHQQVVEIRISPLENAMVARTADGSFTRAAQIVDPVRILSVRPIPPGADPRILRRFLVYPGGSIPRIGIEIGTSSGRKKIVSVDPVTGMPRSENE
jgi:prepilin-type N-terminal cleavage/methylation domain-containing protein